LSASIYAFRFRVASGNVDSPGGKIFHLLAATVQATKTTATMVLAGTTTRIEKFARILDNGRWEIAGDTTAALSAREYNGIDQEERTDGMGKTMA
jgi:hypothetical protein